MAVLVTGGYGQIGSWITREFASKGKDVIIYDSSERNLSYLKKFSDKITYVKGDVLDFARIVDMNRKFGDKIEGVIHIAGIAGGPHFAKDGYHNTMINVSGSVNMLEASRIFGIDKFVYISSGAVYGERDDIPSENDPVSPSDLYGSTKASAELIGLQYMNEYSLDFRVARVYFVYGPGRFPSELYPLYSTIFGPLEGVTEISLEGGRDQKIGFTYVKDTAHATVLLYEKSFVDKRIFNICSGTYMKIPRIIEIVKRFAGSELNIDIGPGKIMPRSPSLDIQRARDELGFKPDYDLELGVKEYAEWINEERNK